MHTEAQFRAGYGPSTTPIGVALVVLVLALAVPIWTGAQMPEGHHVLEYGAVEATTREGFTAGIGHLTLEREGADPSQWIYKGEVFDTDRESMGRVEVQHPAERITEVSYTRADGTARYRARVDLGSSTYEFENVGVEGFTVRHNCDPQQIEKPAYPVKPEAAVAWRTARRACFEDVTVTGAFQTMEEAEEVYGEAIALMRGIEGEITSFLRRYERRLEDGQRRLDALPDGGGGGGGGGMKSFGIGTCPPGYRIHCNTDPQAGNYVPGHGNGFGATSCCIDASEDADVNCQLYGPMLECCSNTLCESTCLGHCSCDLFGIHFECKPYCT